MPLGDGSKLGHPDFRSAGVIPLSPSEIDFNHPLTQGLVKAYYFHNHNTRDLLNGDFPTTDYSGSPATQRPFGFALNNGGSDHVLGYARGDFDPGLGTCVFDFEDFGGAASSAKLVITTDAEWQIWRGGNSTLNLSINNQTENFSFGFPWNFFTDRRHNIFASVWDADNNYRSIEAYYFDYGFEQVIETTAFTKPTGYSNDFHMLNRGDGARAANGIIRFCLVWDRELERREYQQIMLDPYQILKPAAPIFPVFIPVAATDFTLTADAGAVAITGSAAGLEIGYSLDAAAGAVAITGSAAGLNFGYSLDAAADAIAITGSAAGLEIGYSLDAAAGAIAITGSAAGLEIGYSLDAESVAFTITGFNAALTLAGDTTLVAEAGSFAITGATAGLVFDRVLATPGLAGSVAVSPQNYLLRSEDISHADWDLLSQPNTTITVDDLAAPDGTMTADKFENASTTADTFGIQNSSGVIVTEAGSRYALSAYFKEGTQGSFALTVNAEMIGVISGVVFEWQSGVPVPTLNPFYLPATTYVEALPDDWYRVGIITGLLTDRATEAGHLVGCSIYPGSYTAVDAGYTHVWGVQLEYGDVGPYQRTDASRVTIPITSLDYDRLLDAEAGAFAITGLDATLSSDAEGTIIAVVRGSLELNQTLAGSLELNQTLAGSLELNQTLTDTQSLS